MIFMEPRERLDILEATIFYSLGVFNYFVSIKIHNIVQKQDIENRLFFQLSLDKA
jgi:hypothetical protein